MIVNPMLDNRLYHQISDGPTQPLETPTFQQLDQSPKALVQNMPVYPAALRERGVEGRVSLTFYVDQDGRVRMPRIMTADAPEFGEAALAAVSQWQFEQPLRKGRPVVAREQWTFQFRRSS
jgi:TonB family protein